jgi:flagellar biosynthesis protein FlhF
MRLKTFTARDMAEAIELIRREMGPDAVIVASNRTGMGNFEVRAAVEGPAPLPTSSHDEDDAHPPRAPAGDLQAICVRALFHHGVPDPLAVALAAHAARLDAAEPVAALARAMETRFAFQPLALAPHRPLLLVGAPGSGKTSAAARLASRATLGGATADLVCADPEREASRAQIEVYADVIGARAIELRSADELAAWARERDESRPAFVDTPAINPFDDEDVTRLDALVRASGGDPVLVFDAGAQPLDLADQAEVFAGLGCRRAIMTKCDVARRVGGALGVAEAGLALAGLTASPYVGSGITPATPLRLARLVLDESARLAARAGDSEGEWR